MHRDTNPDAPRAGTPAGHRHAQHVPPDDTPRGPFSWLDQHAEQRRRAGLTRTLRPRRADERLLDLASNDYLGLSRHPAVTQAAAAAAAEWGAGSTGSRLVTGSTTLHAEFEAELAEFCGVQAALVFSSGYVANLAAVTALTAPGALIVSDADNHASLIDGCRLARARTAVVPHRDLDAVRKELAESRGAAVVLTESVFSVDGEAAPLAELAAICRRAGAGLLVDDAHGLGVLGPGGVGGPAAAGLTGADDLVVTVTLSKALGSQGGAVLGPARVIRHLIENARGFIFDTGLAPASVGAALAALRLLRGAPERAARARDTASVMAGCLEQAGLGVSTPDAAVVSVRAPSAESAVRWAAQCRDTGVVVGCFRPPSVSDGVSRLRLTARANLSDAEIDRAINVVVRTAPSAAGE